MPIPETAVDQSGYFRQVIDQMLEGCQIIGPDWRYRYLNDAALRHARRERHELLGRTMMEAYPGIEDTELFCALRESLRSQSPARLVNEFAYPDGSTAWFELRIQPVPDGLFVMSLDVTGHKRAEASLRRQLQKLEVLRHIDLAILGSTDWRVTIRAVIREARAQLDVDGAAIATVIPGTSHLEIVAHGGFATPPPAGLSVAPGTGLIGRAALERCTIVAPDLRQSTHDGPPEWFSAGTATHSAYATPLIAKGDVIGVLAVDTARPFDADLEWLSFFEALAGQAAMALDAGRLYLDLAQSNRDIMAAYDTTIEGWSRALDLRDRATVGHTRRVTEESLALARRAGIAEPDLVHVQRGALLHDIGKMGVPDAILLKPGPLTPDEWVIMREHPRIAFDVLSPIEYLQPALDIPWCHHEKWDGTGYPRGLQGNAIPLAARLFAVVDVWDALRSDRPYRARWSDEAVSDYLREQAGHHFDPAAVRLFLDR